MGFFALLLVKYFLRQKRKQCYKCCSFLILPRRNFMTASQQILAAIKQNEAELINIRHDIHAHPEIGFEENRTAKIVADLLKKWGYEVFEGIGKTGVVGVLKNGSSSKTIGLRADMDALPMQEETGKEHQSTYACKMHACGHDGHTTMLLGAAQYLAQSKNFDGTLNLIFQPAEEGHGGASAMMQDGLFERFPCSAIFGMHNMPGMKKGELYLREGPMMASQDSFNIHIKGVGGHGAMPHLTSDALVAAASLVMNLQTIVSRNIDPQQAAVVTVGSIQSGHACNIIQEEAKLMLCSRALDAKVRAQIIERIKEITHATAQTYGCTATIEHNSAFPVLINTKKENDFAWSVATELLGADKTHESIKLMGSEDFAEMLEQKPGSYVFLGNGLDCPMVHNPKYDFDDDNIVIGAAYWSLLVERYLA